MDNTLNSTHIRVSKSLKKFIEEKGDWGESHDRILKRLLNFR